MILILLAGQALHFEDCWTKKSSQWLFAFVKLYCTPGVHLNTSINARAVPTVSGASSHTCPRVLRTYYRASQTSLPSPLSKEDLTLPHLATTATYGASYHHHSLCCPRLAAFLCCLHLLSCLSLGKHRSGPQSSGGPGLAH